MNTRSYDLVVIGGGPAGMAAATEAAAGGLRTLLMDAGDALGGHFYKTLPGGFADHPSRLHGAELAELHAKVDALGRSRGEVWSNTRVWGVFHGLEATFGDADPTHTDPNGGRFTIYSESQGSARSPVVTPALVVAPGVYDRPVPFPGWTLPGVITPGGADFMVRAQGLLPGKRILVAGTGPLQMAVAATLADQGAKVVALLDTCAAGEQWRRLPGALWGQWNRIAEGLGAVRAYLQHRVPMMFQHAVYSAVGTMETGVTGAVIGRVDPDGRPIAGTEKTVDVDTICVAYGFAPSIELTLHLGCSHDFDMRLGLYFPRHDARMQTDVKGVYVAGDVTGVGGKALAALQGQIAAISALEMFGAISAEAAEGRRSQLDDAVRSQLRFGRVLWDRFRVRDGLFDLAGDDTVVCRCENVTAGQVRRTVEQGAMDFRGAKLRSRVGMGVCQGRYCHANVVALMARESHRPAQEFGPLRIRPPLVPISAQVLAQAGEQP